MTRVIPTSASGDKLVQNATRLVCISVVLSAFFLQARALRVVTVRMLAAALSEEGGGKTSAERSILAKGNTTTAGQ